MVIGKINNRLLFENLKFGNSRWIEKSDFKRIGLKLRKDMIGNLQYYKNKIGKGKKELKFLGTVVQNLEQIYDINLEGEYGEVINGQYASNERQMFVDGLSNNGEYLNLGEKIDINDNEEKIQVPKEEKGETK